MTWGLVATAGATLVGGYLASENSADAAEGASRAQGEASAAEIAERRRQFDVMRELLQPWVTSGTSALGQQGNLVGLNGPNAQADFINGIKGGPEFQALQKTGQNAILQNASATGGLRGGNTQAALAFNDQNLLSSLINQQYQRLTGMAGAGQNAAAGVGNNAVAMGNANAGSIGQAGAAQAGGIIGGANAANGFINNAVNAAGVYAGGGGFGARPVAPNYGGNAGYGNYGGGGFGLPDPNLFM